MERTMQFILEQQAQTETQERLDVFVEKYISSRNGGRHAAQ
jgi:hypothetical protein